MSDEKYDDTTEYDDNTTTEYIGDSYDSPVYYNDYGPSNYRRSRHNYGSSYDPYDDYYYNQRTYVPPIITTAPIVTTNGQVITTQQVVTQQPYNSNTIIIDSTEVLDCNKVDCKFPNYINYRIFPIIGTIFTILFIGIKLLNIPFNGTYKSRVCIIKRNRVGYRRYKNYRVCNNKISNYKWIYLFICIFLSIIIQSIVYNKRFNFLNRDLLKNNI